MHYIIIVSHGTFAQGAHSVLDMMVGANRQDIVSLSLTENMSSDQFATDFNQAISHITTNDKISLVGDIIGGSPLTTAMNCLQNQALHHNCTVFGGINMPLLLGLILTKDNQGAELDNEFLLTEAKEAMANISILWNSNDDNNDDI